MTARSQWPDTTDKDGARTVLYCCQVVRNGLEELYSDMTDHETYMPEKVTTPEKVAQLSSAIDEIQSYEAFLHEFIEGY